MNVPSKARQKTLDMNLRMARISARQNQGLITKIVLALNTMGLDRNQRILRLSHEWNVNMDGLGVIVECYDTFFGPAFLHWRHFLICSRGFVGTAWTVGVGILFW